MRAAEIATSVVLLLFSILAVAEAWRLGFGWGLEGPQPGFFIFYLGLGLGICSLSIGTQVLIHKGFLRGKEFVSATSRPRVLEVLLPMAVVATLMGFLGFYVASVLYLGFFMRRMGRFSWATVVLVAAIFALSHYLIFEKWFLVPLPKGYLESYIGL